MGETAALDLGLQAAGWAGARARFAGETSGSDVGDAIADGVSSLTGHRLSSRPAPACP